MKNKKYKDKIGGIYQIRNTLDNKVYIGSTNCFNRRKDEHFTLLKNNKHINKHLQNAFNKYGEKAFIFEILECIKNENELILKEQEWFNKINPCNKFIGYNILNEATDVKRVPITEETKKKISESRKGTIAWNKGLKCPQWSCKNHGMYGKHHSKEAIEKMKKASKGRKRSLETRKKQSETLKRKGHTPPRYWGINHVESKPVRCLKDGKIFENMRECINYYKISYPLLRKHCNNQLKRKLPSFEFISKLDYQKIHKKGLDY